MRVALIVLNMAENNNTTQKEPVYLSYGDQQVNQADFLTGMANEINNYVNNQPWSYKKKQKFMEAYTAIMNQGVTGASIKGGQWHVNHNGTLDIPEEDRQMYEEAAYFIQQQMSNHIKPAESSNTAKKSLTHNDFITGLQSHIGTEHFGGRSWTTADDWDILDSRGKNGARGTEKRANLLSKYLQSYASKINKDDYDFTDSPFGSYEEFQNRINNAVRALGTKDNINDDIEELNKLGIRYKDWFNNGTGDPYTGDSNFTGTYGQYYNEYLPKLEKQKATEQVAKPTIYSSTLKNTGVLYSRRQLADKYGSTEGLLNQIQQYMTKGLNNLTNEEKQEILSAMAYGANTPVSDDEWSILQKVPSLKGSTRNRFKKINGIDNLIYDTATRNTIHLYDENFRNGLQSDFLAGESSKSQEQQYLQSKIPGITNGEWKELMAIGLDIASIVNPEPVTAAGFGIGAADLRRRAKNETPGHKWGFWEKVGQGIDYTTGAIGAVPLIGDLAIGIKDTIKVAQSLPKIAKALRMAARAGATIDLWDGFTQGGGQTVSKVLNGEELTVQDWRNIGQIIRGLAGHHSLNVGNRAFKKTAEKSGFQTESESSIVDKLGSIGEVGRDFGLFRSRIKDNKTIHTLKVKKTSEDGKVDEKEIDLTPEQYETLRKSKPNEVDAKAKGLLKEKIPEGYKVETNTGWRAKAKRLNPLASKNKEIFGSEKSMTIQRGNNEFDTWLKNRGIWSRITYGWNPRLRAIRNGLNIPTKSISTPTTETPINNETQNTLAKNPLVPNSPIAPNNQVQNSPLDIKKPIESKYKKTKKDFFPKYTKEINTFDDFYFQGKYIKNSGYGDINYSDPSKSIKPGEFSIEINGKTITFKVTEEELKNASPNKINEIRLRHAKALQELIKEAPAKKMGPFLLTLKKQGFLKQGGRIDKQKIQMYKNYINK